jgi:hypothetical protein
LLSATAAIPADGSFSNAEAGSYGPGKSSYRFIYRFIFSLLNIDRSQLLTFYESLQQSKSAS